MPHRTKLYSLAFTALAVLILLNGCRSHHTAPRTVVHNRGIHLYHTSIGDAYRGTDGFWYWYLFANPATSSSTSIVSGQPLIAGTSWLRSTVSPQASGQKILSEKEDTEEELEEEGANPPSPELDNAITETEQVEEPATESSPSVDSPSEPSDSGSSDSGSSDSGGGDSGGSSD